MKNCDKLPATQSYKRSHTFTLIKNQSHSSPPQGNNLRNMIMIGLQKYLQVNSTVPTTSTNMAMYPRRKYYFKIIMMVGK